MAAGGRTSMVNDEWESVWQDYDRRSPAPTVAVVPTAGPQAKARRTSPALLLALGLGFAFAPRLVSLQAGTAGGSDGIDGLAMLASFSPAEAELPPLSASVSRLATHSTEAACWVMQLDPRRPACR